MLLNMFLNNIVRKEKLNESLFLSLYIWFWESRILSCFLPRILLVPVLREILVNLQQQTGDGVLAMGSAEDCTDLCLV